MDEESRLIGLREAFALRQDDLDGQRHYTRLLQAAVLRDLSEGKLPNRLRLDAPLPFNFLKSEEVVWVFQAVQYLEDRRRVQYVGGSHGVSVRLAKGL